MSNWKYVGDMNVEEGGYWWRQDRPDDDFVEVVEVFPESCMGGAENVYIISVGSLYLGNEKTLKYALESYDFKGDVPTLAEKVDAVMSYAGIETDYQSVIRVGDPDPYAADSNYEPEQIHGNWKLKNFIKRNYL